MEILRSSTAGRILLAVQSTLTLRRCPRSNWDCAPHSDRPLLVYIHWAKRLALPRKYPSVGGPYFWYQRNPRLVSDNFLTNPGFCSEGRYSRVPSPPPLIHPHNFLGNSTNKSYYRTWIITERKYANKLTLHKKSSSSSSDMTEFSLHLPLSSTHSSSGRMDKRLEPGLPALGVAENQTSQYKSNSMENFGNFRNNFETFAINRKIWIRIFEHS